MVANSANDEVLASSRVSKLTVNAPVVVVTSLFHSSRRQNVKSPVNSSWVSRLIIFPMLLQISTDVAPFNQGSDWQDPCLARQHISFPRLAVFALLFLIAIGGGIFLALLENRPYGIQLASVVIYTAAVALYTFSRNRNGAQPFLLSCPVVRRQLPRLTRRHLGFLAALFLVQTTALEIRPSLPAYWITPSSRDAAPFSLILGVLCLCLAIVQTLTNRSLLDRAHLSAQTEAAP
jgi:hypothetical protein